MVIFSLYDLLLLKTYTTHTNKITSTKIGSFFVHATGTIK